MKRVPATGSLASPLVLIGEAPGRDEERLLKPFVGASGRTLDDWWSKVGLERSMFYIDNVYPYRPPANKLELISMNELSHWAENLHDRLAKLEDPIVIVPTGSIALNALMRTPLRGPKSLKITDWRGSIMSYKDKRGREIKVIPTIHPAATFRQPVWTKLCEYDWMRISADRLFRELRLPKRHHTIFPTKEDKLHWDRRIMQAKENDALAIDIETPGGELVCVGFALDPWESIVLPWRGNKKLIARWCESKVPKVLQNGLYDWFWLRGEGIELSRFFWDIMGMHHAIEPELPHSLAVQASIYTREPFWKHMRDPKERDSGVVAAALQALYHYNGIDCCVTRELLDKYLEKLGGASEPTSGKGEAKVQLARVSAPHFVAGFELEADGRVSEERCAPILSYMRGKSIQWVEEYTKKKGWRLERL